MFVGTFVGTFVGMFVGMFVRGLRLQVLFLSIVVHQHYTGVQE